MHAIKKLFPQALKNIFHLAQAILANVIYGFPSRKIKVIGITGTDGKTTTVQMVTKIFEEAGKSVAMASTINYRINGKEEKNLSHFTTSSAFSLQKFIKNAVGQQCEYLVLETSSHSLHQYRVWGIKYEMALITNVTREHLDYHKTLEAYRKAKEMLFKYVDANNGAAIVNLDMEKPEQFLKYGKNKYAYTTNVSPSFIDQNVKIIAAKNVELEISGSKFNIENTEFVLNLPGKFNVENALAATSAALSENIPIEIIANALRKVTNVPGRMEAVKNERGFNILVDFALTPNALDRLYSLLASVKKYDSKIIAVFGSCGERDRGKRPIMGEIVSKYADIVILTDDEPYREDPKQIIEEIAAGIKNKTKNENLWELSDRREAIRKALQLAKEGDIICVTGMGSFESMVVGNKKIPWNDRRVIQEELAKL